MVENSQPIASTSQLIQPRARNIIEDVDLKAATSLKLKELQNKDHDTIFRELPQLLDEDPQIRNQVSNFLLKSAATAPLPILRQHSHSILTCVTHSLSLRERALPYAAPSSQLLKYISTLLRICSTLLSKSIISTELLSVIVPILSFWCYYRGASDGASTPTLGRTRLDLGDLGSFGNFSISPRKGAGMKRSTSGSSFQSGSESEGENGKEPRSTTAQIRLEALSCVRLLALASAKSLHPYWSFFLSDSRFVFKNNLLGLVESDTSPKVQLKAAHTLDAILQLSEAYLAIADDRPSKASFTSLSSKLSETVILLHQKIGFILSTSISSNLEFNAATLKLARSIIANTDYNRIQRKIIVPLTALILPFLSHHDDSVISAAGLALSTIISKTSLTSRDNSIQILLKTQSLISPDISIHMQMVLWNVGAVAGANILGYDWSKTLEQLASSMDELLSPSLLSLYISFFINLAKSDSNISLLHAQEDLIDNLLEHGLISSLPNIRVTICELLSSLPSRKNNLLEVHRLVEDADTSVASAACRALGLMVKNCSLQERSGIVSQLVQHCHIGPLQYSASWSLANSFDLVEKQEFSKEDFEIYLQLSVDLSGAAMSDKIQTNGIRCVGSSLKVAPSGLEFTTLDLAIQSLISGLHSTSAKVQWNAATAIGNALRSSAISPVHSSLLIQSLLSTLSTPNFKVRVQVVIGITTPLSLISYGTLEQFSLVQKRIELACEEIKLELNTKDSHLASLRIKLESCRLHLLSLSN